MMARVSSRRGRCVICGKTTFTLWTLDNLHRVVVTYLCEEDAAPLAAIMDAAGDLPPDKQVPLPERDLVVHTRGRRQPTMEPLDWTPPD